MPKGVYKRSKETKKRLSEPSLEIRKKISEANNGHIVSLGTRRKISKTSKNSTNSGRFKKGNKMSEERKEKISKANKGRKPYIMTDKIREKMSKSRLKRKECLGYLNSPEIRKKLSASFKGKKSYLWKGGINPINDTIRKSLEMKLWREAVFARDNWTCQETKIKGGKLQAHHIQNFSDFPELRFAIDNGITLSKKAHKEFHKKYGVKNNTKEQLEEFLNNNKSNEKNMNEEKKESKGILSNIVKGMSPTPPKIVEMDFPTALKEIIAGKKITKLEWGNKEVVGVLENERLTLYKDDGKSYHWILSDADLKGEDYIVVD